jgi:hypothetical protein
LIASASTKAIYHSFDDVFPAIGSVPTLSARMSVPSLLPLDYFPELSYVQNLYRPLNEWSYSKAMLNNVQAVRKSRRGGIELQYEKFSVCLGDFRPSEALEWINSPCGFKVSHENSLHHKIDFYRREDTSIDGIRRMEGFIIIWFCQDDIIIETES